MIKLIEKDENDCFKLKISKIEKINHDSYLYQLEFPNKDWYPGLWASGHLHFHAEINGEHKSRKFTPVSPVNQKGSADFVIKIYRKCDEFPEGGKFTQWMENNLRVGDEILCSGPVGKTKYRGWGKMNMMKDELKTKKHIFLVAGGTGITPWISIIQAAVLAQDGCKFTLIDSNKTKEDILCKDQIDDLVKKDGGKQFKVFHTLTRHDEAKHGKWDGMTGRVDLEML